MAHCEEFSITSFHFLEDSVVNCAIPCHLFEQKNRWLDRSELLQVLKVGLQVLLHQSPSHNIPVLLGLHQHLHQTFLNSPHLQKWKILFRFP